MSTEKNDPPALSTLNFEQSLHQLEQLVQQIEDGDLSLDSSLKIFEQGIQLTQYCQKTLTEAEQRVKIITDQQELEEIPHE